MRHCWFKRYARDECRWRYDNQPDPAHLIPQQRIKAELRSRGWSADRIKVALWDKRLVVPACRHHHHAFDFARTITLLSGDYPPALHDWAEDYGFHFVDPRTGWVRDTKEAA